MDPLAEAILRFRNFRNQTVNSAPQSSGGLSQFLGSNSAQGVLGAQAVDRALQSGLTLEQIRSQAAAQGLAIGAAAQQRLQGQPSQNNGGLSQFLGANSSSGVLGAEAYNRALQSGLTPQQIQSQAAAQGLSFGAGVQQLLNPVQQPGPKFSKELGINKNLMAAGGTLSAKELKKIAKVTGKSPDKVLEKAVKKGLSIGSKVVNQYKAQNGISSEAFVGTTSKGQNVSYDPLGSNPILQQINNSPKLDKGSNLFVSSGGSTATVLPRMMNSGGQMNTNQRPVPTMQMLPPAPMAPSTGMTAQDSFNLQDFLNQLAAAFEETPTPTLPPLEAFEPLSSDFEIPDPLQFASLGQSYLSDAIRAARRNSQRRRDYMRNMMMMNMIPSMNRLSIGGGVNVG